MLSNSSPHIPPPPSPLPTAKSIKKPPRNPWKQTILSLNNTNSTQSFLPRLTPQLHFIRYLPFFLNSGRLFSSARISMDSSTTTPSEVKRDVYSVWALPPEELTPRLKKLMEGLRSEFGGPQFEPHATVVGAISLTESEARDVFNKACESLKPYDATVAKVASGTFFYQCVFLLLHPTPEVVEASEHCCGHFGYKRSTPYMPHLSLLYGDLTDEEKKTALEKAYVLDDSIDGLNFKVSRLALYKTDTEDKSCKSWEKVAEYELKP